LTKPCAKGKQPALVISTLYG